MSQPMRNLSSLKRMAAEVLAVPGLEMQLPVRALAVAAAHVRLLFVWFHPDWRASYKSLWARAGQGLPEHPGLDRMARQVEPRPSDLIYRFQEAGRRAEILAESQGQRQPFRQYLRQLLAVLVRLELTQTIHLPQEDRRPMAPALAAERRKEMEMQPVQRVGIR